MTSRSVPAAILGSVLVVSMTIFGPAAPANASSSNPLYTWSMPSPIESSVVMSDVSCPTSSFCESAAESSIYSSIDPQSGVGSWSKTSLQTPGRFVGTSCASQTLCIAIGLSSTVFISNNPTGGPSTWSSTVLNWTGTASFSGYHYLYGASCPTISLCVAVGTDGDIAVSTDPTGGPSAWEASAPVQTYVTLTSVSCPAVSLCVAVGNLGQAFISSDPSGGPSTFTQVTIDPNDTYVDGTATDNMTAVSCPSISLCAAVDAGGEIVTSTDPTGGPSAWTITPVVSGSLNAISCPTISMCVAVNNNAYVSTNPTGGASSWSEENTKSQYPFWAISCPSTSLCVAVGGNVGVASLSLQARAPCAKLAISGQYFSESLSAIGGTPPYSWSIPAQSQLPAGLHLSSSGVISGIYSNTGTIPLSVQVSDSSSPVQSVAQVVSLTFILPNAQTYNLINSNGNSEIFTSFGTLACLNVLPNLNKPIVGATSQPQQPSNYWLASYDGGVFAFGDASFYGSMANKPLNGPIVSITSTSDGKGYWLASSDGGVFAFGDATFYGSQQILSASQIVAGIS